MKKFFALACCVVTLLAAAAGYQRKLPRTMIFSRGQWHYNPVLNYSGRWSDIPLLNDPELNDGLGSTTSAAALRQMEKIVLSYGLDGLASLKGRQTPELIRLLEYNKVPGFILLPEIYASGVGMYKAGIPLAEMRLETDKVFLPAAKSKLTLKHNGKTFISSYNADDRPAEFWQQLLADYRRTEGDKFFFLPLLERPGRKAWHNYTTMFRNGSFSDKEREIIREHFREYARATDGIYLACAPAIGQGDMHTDIEFFREMIKLATEVLAEPEFKDKFFAIAARIGHENSTRVGYIRGSYGSWCYRETMQAALEADPDIIVIPEWDEQNENTSLRPTRFNLSTFTRITRVFKGLSADLPHDDLSVPNLIVSYRKVIALGEKTEYELLGLPDAGGAAEAQFALYCPDGKELFRSQKYTFDGKKMREHRFELGSEMFAPYAFVIPELTVTRNGKTRVYREGLQYIKIEPASNCDYQFAKQPLRDIVEPVRADIRWQDRKITVNFDAGEPIAYAEILDDKMPVYSATADGKPYWRESADEKVFALTFQNIGNHRDLLQGTLSLPGVPQAKWMFDSTAGWPSRMGRAVIGESFKVRLNQKVEMNRIYLAIPAAAADGAVLKIDIPGYFEHELPLAQVLKVHSYGVPGKKVPVLTVRREDYQTLQVKKLRRNQTGFTAEIFPHSRNSVLNFQVITESGKVWRSKPVVAVQTASAKGRIKVWSESMLKPVTLELPVDRIPVYDYKYDAVNGTAVHCDAGLRYSGAGGGYPAHMCGRLGARRDSTVFISLKDHPKNAVTSSVGLGKKAWVFNKIGQHIALPTGVISKRAAFSVTFNLTQNNSAGMQPLLANYSSQPGVLSIYIDNGEVKVEVVNEKLRFYDFATGLNLTPGVPAELKVTCALDKLSVALNGKSVSIPVSSPGLKDTATIIGGGKTHWRGKVGWFNGSISRITVDYRAR